MTAREASRREIFAGVDVAKAEWELASSRCRLERASATLEHKHQEVEGRRRYIETILERIGTWVISIDAAGRLSTLNSAALTQLALDGTVVGRTAVEVFAREDLRRDGRDSGTTGSAKLNER